MENSDRVADWLVRVAVTPLSISDIFLISHRDNRNFPSAYSNFAQHGDEITPIALCPNSPIGPLSADLAWPPKEPQALSAPCKALPEHLPRLYE